MLGRKLKSPDIKRFWHPMGLKLDMSDDIPQYFLFSRRCWNFLEFDLPEVWSILSLKLYLINFFIGYQVGSEPCSEITLFFSILSFAIRLEYLN